jgi:hypothetical protein
MNDKQQLNTIGPSGSCCGGAGGCTSPTVDRRGFIQWPTATDAAAAVASRDKVQHV